jgi:hypothetical protein
MAAYPLHQKLCRSWNWIRGKRIILNDSKRGRVMIRTGHNSAHRNDGGQWYLLRYEVANGLPPLPLCSRGFLNNPVTIFQIERFTGAELTRARRWYTMRYGALQEGQALMLACVFDPNEKTPNSRVMLYRPNEIFEIEYPWLSSQYNGPSFISYFGTWYGSGTLKENDIMDFESFWEVGSGSQPLPKWGASWR